jgi:hypothetical protein
VKLPPAAFNPSGALTNLSHSALNLAGSENNGLVGEAAPAAPKRPKQTTPAYVASAENSIFDNLLKEAKKYIKTKKQKNIKN